MDSTIEYFLSMKPAWSTASMGMPAFVALAGLLILFTIWTYGGAKNLTHSRLKVTIILALRLAALFVTLLTALRPSLGYQEHPKVPSTLLIGIDLSESMIVKDEIAGQTRIEAVRKTLDRCEPIIEQLKTEQNVNVVMYGFGPTEFEEATGIYDPKAPANAKRSDYGTYLLKTLERWQGKQFIRGHLIIGDGGDNGNISAIGEAGRWRPTAPISTFLVGTQTPPGAARDVAIASIQLDPDSVAVKTEYTLRARVNAFGYAGAKVPVKIQYDLGKGYVDVMTEEHTLTREKDNIVEMKLRAPDQIPEDDKKKPIRQIKVRMEIPIASVPLDVNPQNNVIETYLTLTKEGLRVLLVDRYRYEYALILDALALDSKRIDIRKVDLQTDEGGQGLREAFDFNDKAYDVMIIGNVTAKQLLAVDPALPEKIAERVKKHGMGFMMIGGHASFMGDPKFPNATGWTGVKAFEEILPVRLEPNPRIDQSQFNSAGTKFQFVPNPKYADMFFLRVGDSPAETLNLWSKLNESSNRSRFTGLSNIGIPKESATTFAFASPAQQLLDPNRAAADMTLAPLLVGHQIGDGSKGRVLVFGAQDTMLWQRLGQPKSNEGKQIHNRFWRQLVLWLAHQEEDEGAAFAKPDFPRLPVGSLQGIRVGLRGKNGATVVDPKFDVKVFAPNDPTGTHRDVTIDSLGNYKVTYNPGDAGEFTVTVTASGKTANGEAVAGEASAKFFAYPEASDESIRTAADPDFMQKLATAGGGKALRLADLPQFLREMQGQELVVSKPSAKYLPNWNRNESKGFLPAWLAIFAALLGAEWALRRLWGMV